MKVKHVIIGTAVASLLMWTAMPLGAADSTKENRGQFGIRDFRFVKEAAQGALTEVRLGELAKLNGASQGVRDFGQRMITDHGKANEELMKLAASKGAVVPSDISSREISRFEKLTGNDFDKEYIEHMIKDHKKDAKEYKDAIDDVSDPELKAFAQKTLSTVQEHLRMAEQLQTSVK